ncbi:MAG: hypothetical protein CMJ29_06395 [Phycisphaerae bacterium]|nr:hypothetical protein [Phycisphaerae bacterium]|tara:strand:- start:3083 stop:4045 length:963 start_codon:yes stop_codon:yes gene_type:complete
MMILAGLAFLLATFQTVADPGDPVFGQGDRIAIVGNTFAERMQLDGQFESLLHAAHPGHRLSIRNFGWSGDEVSLQPRPLNFIGMKEWLSNHETDVIIACFGMNESYSGDDGLDGFSRDLDAWITTQRANTYNGSTPPRIILVSPIAHEDLGEPLPDGVEHNFILQRYVDAMRRAAVSHDLVFIDLFTPTREAMDRGEGPLTINGIHPNASGYRLAACSMAEQLDLLGRLGNDSSDGDAVQDQESQAAVRRAVLAKNQLFFQRWRPVNTEYVYGRRHEPYGSQNFPDEMKKLDELVSEADQVIWSLPPGDVTCEIQEEDY